ncbi:MAG TPA: hypothetical protein PKE32_01990 [Miltoncostaeaceae bacterium]|nr:hypothetical protein [Miltoncostaeaceae bacterium]
MSEHLFASPGDPHSPTLLIQAAVLHRLLEAPPDGVERVVLRRTLFGTTDAPFLDRALDDAVAALAGDGLAQHRAGRLRATEAARRFHRLLLADGT